MPATIALGLLLVLVFGLAQSGFAQSGAPLNFGNNFFVRGDYVVAGAYGMTSQFANGYAIGTINVPDKNPATGTANPGITGTTSVPPGAEVVAAVLYWQTVEKIGVMPGQPGSGQNGFFRPVINGGPLAPGYPITGVNLNSGGTNTVSWSSGGCTSGSTGKVIRTYRANVLGALPRDASGNISANGPYEVRLPSTASTTPITLGATLVLIYRIFSPSVPLNSIVIYDGDFAPSDTSLNMMQTVQGFYDAAASPVSRLTHIVGNGKSKKLETVYLGTTAPLTPLPSLYGGGQPPFPGYYGMWDNTTWTFDPKQTYVKLSNPIGEDSASATTQVVPASSQQGCVSWGAVLVSTTVKNSDNDGLLDAWKKKPTGVYPNPGYCDAAVSEGVCTPGGPSWVDLPGAAPGQKDVFIQLDYMCSSVTGAESCDSTNGNYSFDPRLSGAVDMVTGAFGAHNVHLHVNPPGTNQPNVHAIQEQTCIDNPNIPPLCAFPNQPGVVAWSGGFEFLKNQLIDPDEPTNLSDCATSPPPAGETCIPRFQPGRRHSWHEVLSAHAVGQPKWRLQDSTLTSVAQSGNMVTFTTSTAIGTLNVIETDSQGKPILDPTCGNGRVTIIGAATNPNLNGTYCVQFSTQPAEAKFMITIGGNSQTGNYTRFTDPNFAVAPGFTSTASGVSDVGGANSLITLGLWGDPRSPTSDGHKKLVLAGTFMHELGHSLGLAHGGPAGPNGPTPNILANCKPNYQSVMSYSVQVDLLAPLTGGPNVPDFSGQTLATLDKSAGGSSPFSSPTTYLNTNWYGSSSDLNLPFIGGQPVGSPAKLLCNGAPIPAGTLPMFRATGPTNSLFWSPRQDINFDGTTNEAWPGADDWDNIDYGGIGTTGSKSGPGQQFGGGGQQFGGGGQQFGGGGEIDLQTVNSITRPPQNLTATEASSPRTITLNWTAPTFGQIGAYNIYRSKNGGAFTIIHTNSGNPPATTFTDNVTCDPGGYRYFVTAVLGSNSTNPGQESVPSNTVSTIPPSTGPLTGCYTFPGFTSPAAGASAIQGSVVPVTWSVKDDFYFNNNNPFVNNVNANTLVAIGPVSNDQVCGAVTANTPRTTIAQSGAGISVNAGSNFLFTFNWNTTGFAAGCYLLELDLDSGQPQFGGQPASAFQVLIYLSDVSLQVTTTALPDGVVGSAYNKTLTETGGTTGGGQPFTWTVISGALPPGIALGLAPDAVSGALTGTPTVPGNYNFTVQVTDSIGDFGTQTLAMRVDAAVINTLDSGPGSLRQAILDVNAQSNSQPIGIVFNIPGNGVRTITPLTPLPTLMSPTILDATTQPGYAGTPLIELNGSSAGASANGLHVAGGSSIVVGLVVDSFSGDGILIDTNSNDVIQGNYVGTDPTGTLAKANGGNGVQIIDTPNNVIGGTTSSARNIISGNTGEGVRIDGALATGNVVQGNYIGTNVSGSAAVGNNASGVYIRRAPGNSVIGNTVSGNVGFAGITICGSITFCGGGDNFGPGTPGNRASGNIVQGNFVGTNPAGTTALGNNQAGVSIDGAPNTKVGGTTAALHNIISFNGTNDVQIFDPGAGANQIQANTIQGSTTATTVGISVDASLIGNTLTQNSISGHAGLGIDLSPSGINPNQTGGANNFPVITSAQFASGTTTIMGTLNSTANAKFTIEFFSNQACNTSGNGEGAVFLGSISIQTDGSGNAGFVFMVVGPAVGNAITSTSTDAFGTTSEFSACAPVN